MSSITLEEAKSMISSESIDKLKEVVYAKPVVDTNLKANCDILMTALCIATETGVIRYSSLDEKTIKLLNSPTSTLSAKKLGNILSAVRESQPNMFCVITLKKTNGDIVNEWLFSGPTVYFNKMFEYVVDSFEITPQMIRQKMGSMLKMTIVNNIAQLAAKYQTLSEEERKSLQISITTISRLVNMSGYLLYAEFKEIK